MLREKNKNSFVDIKNLCPNLIEDIQKLINKASDYNAFQIACNYNTITDFSKQDKAKLDNIISEHKFIAKRLQATETVRRYKAIDQLLEECVEYPENSKNNSLTQKLDNILTHPIYGLPFF